MGWLAARETQQLTADVPLLTCGLHAVAAEIGDEEDADAEEFDVDLDESVTITMVKDRVVQEAGVTLPTAPVVVGGGRGVGSEDGFGQLVSSPPCSVAVSVARVR